MDWTAPPGTLTDGASIPKQALSYFILPDDPKVFNAAVIHDAYCQKSSNCPDQYRSKSHLQTHKMYYEACLACGATQNEAALMLTAIRLFGPKWDSNKNDIPNSLSEVGYTAFDIFKEMIFNYKSDSKDKYELYNKLDQQVVELEKHTDETYAAIESSNTAAENGKKEQGIEVLKNAADSLDNSKWNDPKYEPVRLALRGNVQKKCAALWNEIGKEDKAIEVLNSAEQDYNQILKDKQNDTIALTGISGVNIIRSEIELKKSNLKIAEEKITIANDNIDKALKITPNFDKAINSKKIIKGIQTDLNDMKNK